jgi:hypothetical protein
VNDVEVPPKFWWARGHEALTQNWSTGDFERWIDKRAHYKAYGVKFLRAWYRRTWQILRIPSPPGSLRVSLLRELRKAHQLVVQRYSLDTATHLRGETLKTSSLSA